MDSGSVEPVPVREHESHTKQAHLPWGWGSLPVSLGTHVLGPVAVCVLVCTPTHKEIKPECMRSWYLCIWYQATLTCP